MGENTVFVSFRLWVSFVSLTFVLLLLFPFPFSSLFYLFSSFFRFSSRLRWFSRSLACFSSSFSCNFWRNSELVRTQAHFSGGWDFCRFSTRHGILRNFWRAGWRTAERYCWGDGGGKEDSGVERKLSKLQVEVFSTSEASANFCSDQS